MDEQGEGGGRAAAGGGRMSRRGGVMRDEVIAFKRERILEEAAAAFYEHGYQGTTLEAVATRLGVTKPFIYYHFRNKAEILSEICRRGITEAVAALDAALAAEGTPDQRLAAAIEAITRTVLEQQAYTAIYFREEKNYPADDAVELNRRRKAFDHKLSALLKEGVAAGVFEIEDVRLTALAIGGMISWAFTWYNPQGRLSTAEICRGMAGLVLRMVRRPE